MSSTGAQGRFGGREPQGMQTSPELARELVEGAAAAAPSSEGGLRTSPGSAASNTGVASPSARCPAAGLARRTDEGAAGGRRHDDRRRGVGRQAERAAGVERTGTRPTTPDYKCAALGETSPWADARRARQIGTRSCDTSSRQERGTSLGADPTVMRPAPTWPRSPPSTATGLDRPPELPCPMPASHPDRELTTTPVGSCSSCSRVRRASGDGRRIQNSPRARGRHLASVRGWLSECSRRGKSEAAQGTVRPGGITPGARARR